MMYSNPNPNPFYAGGAMQYNPQMMQMPKQHNNLSAEEIKSLQSHETFSLRMTSEEKTRSACNHRTADGMQDSLIAEPDGSYRCTICGARFFPVEPGTSKEDIQDAVDRVLDILQTTKMLYINMPPEAAKEYYQIIPLIQRIPELFKISADTYSRYERGSNWSYNSRNCGAASLYNMVTGGMPYQQPTSFDPMGQPYQQQGYYQQPMAAPQGYQQNPNVPVGAVAPGVNPFVGQPMAAPQGYQPTMAGFQYQPGMNAPQAAPQAGYQAPQQTPPVQPTAQEPTTPAPAAPVATPNNDKVQVATTIKA